MARAEVASDKVWTVIRYEQGHVDDVAISCDMFRLEQMDTGVWWAACYRGDKRVAFWFRRQKRDIVVTVIEDELGCVDDSEPDPGALLGWGI